MMKKTLTLALAFCVKIGLSQTVSIGTQVWSSENLDVSHFRNGDPIKEAKTQEEWDIADKNEEPAWCYYDNDFTNGYKNGKLYNWYAVSDPRGLAPNGFHIPSDSDWNVLTKYLGGADIAGRKMKSTVDWNENGNGTNESQFFAYPSGARGIMFCTFGYHTGWWSIDEKGINDASFRDLSYNGTGIYTRYQNKGFGLSVRCIKDKTQ
jgi:uncharacterized protein (TIGR02145 family)